MSLNEKITTAGTSRTEPTLLLVRSAFAGASLLLVTACTTTTAENRPSPSEVPSVSVSMEQTPSGGASAAGSRPTAGPSAAVSSSKSPSARESPEAARRIRDSSPGSRAPERTFTGDVYVDDYFRREPPSRLAGASVTFAPGSRTPWKVNPLGQTVVVTSGVGWAQCEGEKIAEIREGDVIWFPPNQRHWEGATPDQDVTYVAVQEEGDRGRVNFKEKVTDEVYQSGPSAGGQDAWSGCS